MGLIDSRFIVTESAHILPYMQLHRCDSHNVPIYAGVEIGFNDSNLVATEGQSEPANVCVQVTSGVLQRNVSVYLDTVNIAGTANKGTLLMDGLVSPHILHNYIT